MTDKDDYTMPNTAAIEVLRNFANEDMDPRVAKFAHFLAERISPEVEPGELLTASLLLMYDLQTGTDGFTQQQIESDLVGIGSSEQAKILRSVPDLARLAFGDDFADQVRGDMVRTGLISESGATEEIGLDATETIEEPIDTAVVAYEKIVVSAADSAASLDWGHFGLTETDIAEVKPLIEDTVIPISLRNAPYPLAVNLLVDERNKEAGLLQEMLPEQKKVLHGKYWFGLMRDVITPEEAMFARDHAFLKAVEGVVRLKSLSIQEVRTHFGSDPNSPVVKAGDRLTAAILKHHPELLG